MEKTHHSTRIGRAAVAAYAGMQIFVFGALASETVLLYPNIFHDIPTSFDHALAFLQVTDPGAVFPPLGLMTIVLGALALGLTWRSAGIRRWLATSLVVFVVGNGLVSVLFAWPRNTIMFLEGAAMHSTGYLEQVAAEFMFVHGVRLASSAIASALVATGILKLYRIQRSRALIHQEKVLSPGA